MMKAMLASELKAVIAIVLVLGLMATEAAVLANRTWEKQGNKPPTAAERAKPPQNQRREEDFTAWGEEAGGLKAGLSIRPGPHRDYKHGETVTLVVRVRNVGKEEVKFEYLKEFFVEIPPTVTDADGKAVRQRWKLDAGGLGHVPKEMSLAPGKEIELADVQYELWPANEREKLFTAKFPPLLGAGKVSVQYERVFGNSSLGRIKLDPNLSKLATGKLELEIEPDPPARKDGGTAKAQGDEESIQGVWTLVNLEQVSHQPTEEEKDAWRAGVVTITIRGNKLTYDADKSLMYFKLEPSQSPKVMTLEVPDGPNKGRHVPAIYRLDGDDLMICQGRLEDTQPPASFSITDRRPGTFPTLWVLKRRPSPLDAGREVKNADRSRGKTNTNAPTELPGKKDSIFGGGPNEPRYMRSGNLFFVTSPLGDKFSIYNAETNKASTIRLPGSKESSLQVTPIQSQHAVSLMLNGPKITRLYIFSFEDWKWYPQELKEPVAGTASPIMGRSVAAYAQGRTIYAFSTEAKRWSVFELPQEAPAQPGMSVSPDSIVVEYDGHIYEFSGKTGEWRHTDLRALIDAAIRAAGEGAK